MNHTATLMPNGLVALTGGTNGSTFVNSTEVFDPSTGLLFFDLFNFDGILGDRFLVYGKIQPFFEVESRRYRFRVLDSGPSLATSEERLA